MPYHGPNGRISADTDTCSSLFVKLPLDALDDPNLSDAALRLLARLLWYAWRRPGLNPGTAALAADMRASKRTLRRLMRQLEQSGWLHVVPGPPGRTPDLIIPSPLRRLPLDVQGGQICPPRGPEMSPERPDLSPPGGTDLSPLTTRQTRDAVADAALEARRRHHGSALAAAYYLRLLVDGVPPDAPDALQDLPDQVQHQDTLHQG